MKMRFSVLLLCLLVVLTGCSALDKENPSENESEDASGKVADLGDDSKTFGESLDALGAYDGYFEGETDDVTVTCESGMEHAYRIEESTLIFSNVSEESVYSISGNFRGNIVIDVGDSHKFDLELLGCSVVPKYGNVHIFCLSQIVGFVFCILYTENF